ncbi:MAG TPA: c-type cytochrome [Steroidobacteraceae bacterium]|nr:c-type cytochrome [Steroidobacteraceae bacterium]
MIRKLFIVVVLGIVVSLAGLAAWTEYAWNRKFDAPYPAIHASTDRTVVARGQYLAFGPAHCAGCHVSPQDEARLQAGETPPLSGGVEFPLGDLGTIGSPNITPDAATGIGRRSDGEIARVIRYSVHADGRALLPFMEFQTLSDSDLTALVSFLRSQAPVSHAVAPFAVKTKGMVALAFFVKPIGPKSTPAAEPPPASDVLAYGGYLVESVAQCAGCHTNRSMTDGSYTGPRLAGGWAKESDSHPGVTLVTPNLTPDPDTGRIARWSEDDFVQRFRAGKLVPESDMPWALFAHMTDDDLRAVYRYLRSLAPVRNDTGESVRRK